MQSSAQRGLCQHLWEGYAGIHATQQIKRAAMQPNAQPGSKSTCTNHTHHNRSSAGASALQRKGFAMRVSSPSTLNHFAATHTSGSRSTEWYGPIASVLMFCLAGRGEGTHGITAGASAVISMQPLLAALPPRAGASLLAVAAAGTPLCTVIQRQWQPSKQAAAQAHQPLLHKPCGGLPADGCHRLLLLLLLLRHCSRCCRLRRPPLRQLRIKLC